MHIAALTGAGISAESGVPTFRGAAGLWKSYRPEELATPEAFYSNPQLVWEFYAWRRQVVSKCKPNQAHFLLAQIQNSEQELRVITQNVDGLHQSAGSEQVIELHGSLWRLRCTQCHHKWTSLDVTLSVLPPSCPECGSLARPDVIWFGEALDTEVLQRAYKVVEDIELLLVIGTSAQVYPAAGIPQIAKANGAAIVEINPQETPISDLADEIFREPATSGVAKWWQRFQEKV
jgi:NAD-dependent deacetylase